MKVFCYRNLRFKHVMWSVRDCKSKLVVNRTTYIWLKDVELKVSQAGRARVLRDKRKNVHAGVQGISVSTDSIPVDGWIEVAYNPYKFDSFVNIDTLEPVYRARYARLTPTGLFVIV